MFEGEKNKIKKEKRNQLHFLQSLDGTEPR